MATKKSEVNKGLEEIAYKNRGPRETNAAYVVAGVLGLTGFDANAAQSACENLRDAIVENTTPHKPEVQSARTGDTIIYTKQTRDSGRVIMASWQRFEVVPNELTRLAPIVVNIEEARAAALAKLDALDRLILGL